MLEEITTVKCDNLIGKITVLLNRYWSEADLHNTMRWVPISGKRAVIFASLDEFKKKLRRGLNCLTKKIDLN